MTDHPGIFSGATPASRQESVARDLDAIFGDRRSRPAKGTAVAVIPSRDGRSSWRWILLVGLVVTALAVAAAVLLLGYGSPPAATKAAGRAPAVVTARQLKASTPTIHATGKPAADAPVIAALGTTSQEHRPVAAVATNEREPRPGSREPHTVSSVAKADRPVRSRPDAGRGVRCGEAGSNARAWCLRPRVLAANRELTRLYDQARRAGVDSRALGRLRGQWASVQRRANSHPDAALVGYRNLRLDLLDLLDDQRANDRDD